MTTKTERINVRCSEDSLSLLRDAAELQGQDLTSFIMGASLERARAIMAEERVLRLSPAELLQVESALDSEGEVNPRLAVLVRAMRGAQTATS